MFELLLVDDDVGTIETFEACLRLRGFGVRTAQSAADALTYVRQHRVDLMLADLRLPDLSGIEILRCLRAEQIATPVIIMTAFGTVRSAVEATRLGAIDYLEKPLFEDDLLEAIANGLTSATRDPDTRLAAEPFEPHAATRWAASVVAVLNARADPSTLAAWARVAHASAATLKNRCRVAGIPTKASLDFARVLRAVVLAQSNGCEPAALLDGDPRTLKRLLETAGLSERDATRNPRAVATFITRQQLICEPMAIAALRRGLTNARVL